MRARFKRGHRTPTWCWMLSLAALACAASQKSPPPPEAAPKSAARPATPLPAEAVLFSLRGKESTARACFEASEPAARGNVRVSFDVTEQGQVRRANVEGAELQPNGVETGVGECLTRFVSDLHFDVQPNRRHAAWTFVAGLGDPEIVAQAQRRARQRGSKKGFDKPTGKRAKGRNRGVEVDPDSTGSLPRDRISDVAEAGFRLYAHCLREGLDRNRYLSGRVLLRFTIDGSGRVQNVRDAGSDLPDLLAIDCVAQGFYAMKFPAPSGGSVAVTYPILLNED